MQKNQTPFTPLKKLFEAFDRLEPEIKERIIMGYFGPVPHHASEESMGGLELRIVLYQIVGGTLMALARKIAAKYDVNFEESYCVNPGEDPEGGDYIYKPSFHIRCFSGEKIREKVMELIQAEDELNARCERLADFAMKLPGA